MDGFARRMAMGELSPKAYERRVQAAFPVPLEEEATSLYVPRVSCPVLVLHDENDEMIPTQAARDIASADHASLELTQGLGHRGIIRDPGTMARVVEFLSEA
jgi:pimeloyl-ACP methyl ester carboxylesterase